LPCSGSVVVHGVDPDFLIAPLPHVDGCLTTCPNVFVTSGQGSPSPLSRGASARRVRPWYLKLDAERAGGRKLTRLSRGLRRIGVMGDTGTRGGDRASLIARFRPRTTSALLIGPREEDATARRLRLGHLNDGGSRSHQGRHIGRRFTSDERALFTKYERGATTHRLQILADGLAGEPPFTGDQVVCLATTRPPRYISVTEKERPVDMRAWIN